MEHFTSPKYPEKVLFDFRKEKEKVNSLHIFEELKDYYVLPNRCIHHDCAKTEADLLESTQVSEEFKYYLEDLISKNTLISHSLFANWHSTPLILI